MSFLQLDKVHIGYREALIQNINANLSLGDVCLLIGNNGIGKTTLFKTILGQNALLGGQILIDNQNIEKLSHKEISSQIAMVFSKAEIPENYTVKDLIALGKYNHYPYYFKLSAEDEKEVSDIINKLQLTPFRDKKLTELSDGNLQKAFIGRALAQNTPCIILDEPTTHLDEDNKLMILFLLRTLAKQEHKLILFSSHDWRLAKEFADKLWWITAQQLINGVTEEVILQHPELSKAQLFNLNPYYKSPKIIAPILENELAYSYLQKNFVKDLSSYTLSFENGFWTINSVHKCQQCQNLEEVKQLLQQLINEEKIN